jgi:hypothetical protein
MHKIDTPSAVDNQFVDRNASSGVPGTVCDSSWLNAVQNEICNVVEGAGMELDRQDNGQLNKAIKKIADSAAVRNIYSSEQKEDAGVYWCKIGSEFQIKDGDVVDITVESRWSDLSYPTDLQIRLVTPSITHEFCHLPQVQPNGYFSLRCVFKYHSEDFEVTPGTAYFLYGYMGETNKYSFRLNGVISTT